MGLFLPGDRKWIGCDSEVAEKLGLNTAMILAQIISSIEGHIDRNETARFFRDGRWWMFDTAEKFARVTTLSVPTVKRILSDLKKLKILQSAQYELAQGLVRCWYSVDKDKLLEVLASPPTVSKRSYGGDRINLILPSDQTDTTHGINLILPIVSKRSSLSITHTITHAKDQTTAQDNPSVTPLPLKRPKRERPPKAKVLKFLPQDVELAKDWLKFALNEMKWAKTPSGWTEEEFASGIAKVRENVQFDGKALESENMKQIFNFIQDDKFWRKNAWSPIGLLKKNSEGIRKIDNILRQMKPNRVYEEEKMKEWKFKDPFDFGATS